MNRLLLPCLLSAIALPNLAAQRLVAVDSNHTLYTIDLVTAQKVAIGSIANVGTPGELVHDAATGETFVASASTDSLYTVDLATGVATLVGPFGDPAILMHGLELDTSTGQLYGASQHNGGLYAVDRNTGAATLLGTSGLGSFTNLGYDARTDTLFATNGFVDTLHVVDRTNGALTLVGPLTNSVQPAALAFDSDTGVMYLLDNVNDQLFAVDTVTGRANSIGSTGVGNLLGLAYLPGGSGSLHGLPHHCGSVSILTAGDTDIGGAVTTWVDGVTGVPLVGYGLGVLALPFCGCTVGHEWAWAAVGGTHSLAIPSVGTLLGLDLAVQALDVFGVGGCADPAIALSDTIVLTIG